MQREKGGLRDKLGSSIKNRWVQIFDPEPVLEKAVWKWERSGRKEIYDCIQLIGHMSKITQESYFQMGSVHLHFLLSGSSNSAVGQPQAN